MGQTGIICKAGDTLSSSRHVRIVCPRPNCLNRDLYKRFWVEHQTRFWRFSFAKWKSSLRLASYTKPWSIFDSRINVGTVNWFRCNDNQKSVICRCQGDISRVPYKQRSLTYLQDGYGTSSQNECKYGDDAKLVGHIRKYFTSNRICYCTIFLRKTKKIPRRKYWHTRVNVNP
jgi:hypothetical protein